MKSDFYTRIYLWLVAHRRLVLGTTVLLAAIAIAISSRVNLEEDILAILPQHDPVVEDHIYTIRKFRQIDRVYLDVGINRDDPEILGQAADEMYAGLDAMRVGTTTNAIFARITYRVELNGLGKSIDFLTGALPNLFTEADAQSLEARLQPDEVRKYLTEMRRQLAGPQGVVIKDVLAADPVNMTRLVLDKVKPLLAGLDSGRITDGRITSTNGQHVLMMSEPIFTSSNSRNSVELVADMLRLAHEVETHFPGVHVAITGGHRMSVDNSALIKSDATRCIVLGMSAMLVLCLSAYRRKWLAVVTFLPSLFGTLMAGAVLLLWDRHLSAIATGFATIAIGITVDYGIYVVYHLDNAALDRKSAAQIVRRLLLPMAIGVMTIIAAFAVLATSPMRGYQQLGVFGAVGVMVSAAFALFVLPLLIPLPKQDHLTPLRFTRWMEAFHAWQKRWRPVLFLGVVALTVVTAFGVKRLRFEGDITKMNGITQATRDDAALFDRVWGDALNITLVVVRGATVDEALAQNDRAAEVLAHQPGVTGVFSLAAVCPSRADQETNIRRWHEFWTPARQAALRQTLQQIGGEMGFRPDAFAPFWKSVEAEPALVTLDRFRGTPLEQALSERTALSAGDNAISTIIQLKDRAAADRLRAALPGMIVVDQKAFASHIAALAKSGMGHFALWTGVAVAAIVFFALTAIELVAATLLPLGIGLLWTLGLMGWLGLPIDMMNCVFVIFVIGIGEDYGVFLATSKLDPWRGHPQRIAPTSASVMISAVTTISGFAVLIFARHPVLYSMGTTVLLGMTCSFAATLIITPLCMDLLLYRDPPRGAPRWWHPLGTIWVLVHLGGSQVFLYYVLRPVLKVFSPRTADDQVRRATRWMARGVVKGLPFGKLEFQNITRETFSPPCIVISNHQSAVDVMLMVSLPGDVRQTAKKRVFDAPMLGIGCKVLGHVMVEPNDPETTLRRCREKLAEGACVHFYPEGTRSPDGFMQRFHRGAFDLAVQLKQDILPIVLGDTWTAMPRDAWWFEPYHVTVRALPRITPQTFDYTQGGLALMRHCESVMRAAFQKQLDELNTPRTLRRKVNRLYRYQGAFVEQFARWKMKLDPMFESLDQVVPREGFILDLGCGYGLVTHWLAHCTDGRTFLGVDFDENKVRVARRTAPDHPRVKFELHDLLAWEYPACDTVLLMDVLHYWTPEKQQLILDRARRALRPGGRLILRDGAREESAEHRRVHRWEIFATRIGHNREGEGLNFQSISELTAMLQKAGFARWEIRPGMGRDSNVLLLAWV